MFKHELGLKAKDQITGFKGIIVGRCEHLFGCNTYGICPKIGKDGKIDSAQWFDEGRLTIIGRGVLPQEVKAEKPGAGSNPSII